MRAEAPEWCYNVQQVYDTETGKTKTIKTPKDIQIDVKRPDNGQVGVESVYDASNSKTPSGSINYKWERASGGFELLGSTDQATVRVNALQSVNSYTRITVIDPVCGIASASRIDANYWP